MKLRNLFLASVVLAGLFSACSNEMDEVVNNNTNETIVEGNAYASFALQFPTSTETRAAEPEYGTATENKITDVTLLFFDDVTFELKDIKTLSKSAFTEGKQGFYTLNEPFLVSKGIRLVYAFVNAQPTIKALTAGTAKANGYDKIMGIGTETAASMSGDGTFSMSNAEAVSPKTLSFTTKAAAEAEPITMKVERTVAKVLYTGAATPKFDILKYGSSSDKIGEVTLKEVQLVNANSKYYYLRRVSSNANGTGFTVGGAEIDGTNYVVDPNFTGTAVNSDFSHSGYKSLTAEFTSYCLENTMNQASQYNAVTTGLMFKAEIMLKGEQAAKTFYRYNGTIYTDVVKVKEAANITADVAAWKAGDWKAKGVDFFENGICYYPYWIKHVPYNNPSEMGIMEFGVVRNNVYKYSVKSISAIGQPTDEIDPENPDKNADTYISVALEVKKWTVRSNENIEL